METNRILVGMSGGVDSSVAVKLLREMGYSPVGLYLDMKSGNDCSPVKVTDAENECADVKSALQCASLNGIELYKMGCADEFKGKVIEYFMDEYCAGRTPNPCTVCNRFVKFDALLRAADMLCCEKVATGHYACIDFDKEQGRYFVVKGADERKDQSYMLWRLSQKQLSRLVFPLGEIAKKDVFDTARSEGYISAERGESLDICFLPDGVTYSEYIEEHRGESLEGDFISPDGEVCGKHKGIIHYTVGQRKGLGISLGEPVFVTKIDKEENKIYLGRKTDETTDCFVASNVCFMKKQECESFSGEYDVKIRYAAKPVRAYVTYCDGVLTVKTSEPVRAVTPGQSLVAYEDNCVAFGGVIN